MTNALEVGDTIFGLMNDSGSVLEIFDSRAVAERKCPSYCVVVEGTVTGAQPPWAELGMDGRASIAWDAEIEVDLQLRTQRVRP